MQIGRTVIALISFTLLPFIACIGQEKKYIGGPYYFESFANYKIPFRPTNELTPDAARTHDAYYIAYFNSDGKIVSFTKYLYGKMEFEDKYFYRGDGKIERRELSRSNGETTVQYFDEKGKLIPEKP
jgi:hypothetical protein